MLFAIQVFFTYKAFESGWRFWVLVPWALMLAVSITVGSAAAGAETIDIAGVGFLLDLVLAGVLVYMARHDRGDRVDIPADIAPPVRFFDV